MKEFNYLLDYEKLNLREQPQLYRVGRGEQGVLRVQPYKDELLPHWRFATPELARESSDELFRRFKKYLANGDFVGADMARKFIQMGYTRARRYANHAGGKKYDGPVPADRKGQSGSHGRAQLPQQNQNLAKAQTKAASAAIFKAAWDQCRADEYYQLLRKKHQQMHETEDQNDQLPPEFFLPEPPGHTLKD